MRKLFSNIFETYVIDTLRKVPGEEKFGNYRFLPFFFLFGATVEYLMIHIKAGPNQVNFCEFIYLYLYLCMHMHSLFKLIHKIDTTLKRRQAENIILEKEKLEESLLTKNK
jgi:hypothetical protein